MSEAEAVPATETAEAGDLTDDQVEQFFEMGGVGEAAPLDEEGQQQEQETEPEQAAEAKPEPGQDKGEKTVPYGALHEERMRRKELQQQVEATAQKTQQMEEAFRRLVERAQAEPEPDFDQDPLNALRYENEQMAQRLAHYDQRFQHADQQQDAYRQQQEFVSGYQQAAAQYSREHPEFSDAYQHLVQTRQSDLMAMGYNETEAGQIMVQEEAAIVAKANQDGVNPAERIHKLAQHRGWQAAPKEEQTPQKSDAAAKLESMAKGQKAAQTLSGGGKAPGDVSLEALAGLTDEEFDAAWEKLIGPNQ